MYYYISYDENPDEYIPRTCFLDRAENESDIPFTYDVYTIIRAGKTFESLVELYKKHICKPQRLSSLSYDEYKIIEEIWENYKALR